MSALKQFTGFKGSAAMVRIGKIEFFILARNPRQVETLWNGLLREAGEFDPSACRPAILVASDTFPERKLQQTPAPAEPPASSQPPIDI